MDKDFIKIDDLVKLRLGGVEETERSGSWLSMRELLDKEMPQDRPGGIIYWRRTFSVVAALSLLATIGIGSYEFSSSLNGRYGDGNVVVADAATTKAAVPEKGSEVNNVYQLQDAENASADKKHEIAARIASAKRNVHEGQQPENANNGPAAHRNKYAAGNPETSGSKAEKAISSVAATTTGNNANNNMPAAGENITNGQRIAEHKNVNTVKNNNRHTANNTVHTTTTTGVAHESTAVPSIPVTNHDVQPKHKGDNKDAATTKAVAIKTTHTQHHKEVKATDAPVAANADKKADKNAANNGTGIDKLALGSAATLATKTGATAAPAATEKAMDINAVAAKDATAKNGATGNKAATIKADSRPAANANTAGKTAGNGSATENAATPNGTVAANNMQKISPVPAAKVATPAIDMATLKNMSVTNMSKGKKVIERMILHEHYIKTSPGDGYFKLDTISVETVTTELGLKNDNASSHTSSYMKKGGAPSSSAAAKAAGGQEEAADANGAIVPAATANQSGASLKAANAAQKSSGSKIVQKLNATFNDIKYKFGAPKFQMGVTAGINSTFFGPNSFKGFQFGLTGNLVFNEQWSILSELKYFHRINGNTAIEDNYSTYTPAANGQFSKQQQLNSYSFSALHSLEMPVSIRYCMGNFNFFAGGNLVYTFSINTGAETIPATSAPTLVSAPGTDNAPQLKEEDFRSRIGLGYLLGLSYNVAPSTMLDLRSVQTVWDNAGSAGAKMISSQLYKSPSLQLSIIYRLGGNRGKE